MTDEIAAAKVHPLFKRAERAERVDDSEARLVFAMPGDQSREDTVAVVECWLKPK